MRPLLLVASGVLLYLAWHRAQASQMPEGDVVPITTFDDGISDLSNSITASISGGSMQLSNTGLQAIMSREGFSPTPYSDAGGWSIGYGHFIQAGESFGAITADQAAALLASDVQKAVNAVNADVTAPLTQNQFDALVSLVYNIGAGAFGRSTLLKLLNAGDYGGAQVQFGVWRMSQGGINPVLVARRQDEAAQFAS